MNETAHQDNSSASTNNSFAVLKRKFKISA